MVLLRLLPVILVPCFIVFSQISSPARLSPAQRIYGQFRSWANALPAADQRSPDLLQKYREHLKSAGLSEGDIDAQVKTIEQRAERLEAERWNQILTAEKPSSTTYTE